MGITIIFDDKLTPVEERRIRKRIEEFLTREFPEYDWEDC